MTSKVLFLTSDLGGGGAERVLLTLAETMQRPAEVVVLGSRRAYETNVVVHHLNADIASARSMYSLTSSLSLGAYRLRRLLNAQPPGTQVVSFTFWPNVLNWIVNQDKAILSVRTTPSKELAQSRLEPVLTALLRQTYSRARRITAISEGSKEDLVLNFGLSPDRIRVLHNPVDEKRVDARESAALPNGFEHLMARHPTVIAVGRLEPPKGHRHLLRIFRQIHSTMPNVRLIILGEGSHRGDLVELTRALGLRVGVLPDRHPNAEVFLPGFVSSPYSFVRKASLFAFPSIWEGLGNSLVEAMVVGAAVVAADCKSGPRELLLAEGPAPKLTPRGLLLPAFDNFESPQPDLEVLWAEEMARLLDDEPLRAAMGREAALSVRSRFSLAATLKAWDDVLDWEL